MTSIRLSRIPYRRFKTMRQLIMVLLSISSFLLLMNLPQKPQTIIKRSKRNLTIWSNDFHISTIQDVKYQLQLFNVVLIDNSLSNHCGLTKTCAEKLKVLNKQNGISPTIKERQEFYEAYKNDPVMNQVDAFICFHPTAMCEVFMPFNRPLIIIASTRYEMGRFSREEWTKWNKNLRLIALNPRNIIAANNLYDAEYIRYFTGIKPIILPSLCDYTKASYSPKPGRSFLITTIFKQQFRSEFIFNLTHSIQRLNSTLTVDYLRSLYKDHYDYSDIAGHPGMIYVPYQVSLMSLFEQYRMNIPLFFPSIDLLTEWHYIYRVIDQRTWDDVNSQPSNASIVPGVLGVEIPDPNNEFDRKAIRYWLQFSDFYQWPHITYFNSTDDLVEKLMHADLNEISRSMKIYNVKLKERLHEQWEDILRRVDAN
ncbi:unnamed protein product [Adineta ricciae]|uniref:Uncharacterized protein n=1 Tax=Adineta ricciae TaxID=249248 RepID=A0A815V1A1_ADIRI|nr:unnamed protein product [Adineta ricciae]CAF1544278.1 unnamed protein product [Adineta ricciae]